MNYQLLYTEVTTDPVGMGYAGKTDAEVAALLNSPTGRTIARDVIDTWEIVEATVPAEWTALTTAEKQRYQTIVGAGRVSVKGTNVRAAFAQMFGAGTQTRTNLLALQNMTTSRANELGLGAVTAGDVTLARGGQW